MTNRMFLIASVFAFLSVSTARGEIDFALPAGILETPPRAVFLVGSFNDWNTTATPMALEGAAWRVAVALPDGRHEYKLIRRDAGGETHWMNDPANPFLVDNGISGANNFVDVRGGVRVEITEGLEKFEWPPPKDRPQPVSDGTRTWFTTTTRVSPPEYYERYTPKKWAGVAGDFNDWRLGQFPMVRCRDGAWRAHIPIRRPFSYKIIADGIWRLDPGNDPLPTILVGPGHESRELSPRTISRVPDGYGRFNSHREQAEVTSPALVTIDRAIAPGDPRELALITSYAAACDYGRAVVAARKVREANAQEAGGSSDIGIEALAMEARIHKRWARFNEAVQCWEALVATDAPTTPVLQAAQELIAYRLHVTKDHEAARRICEWALRQLPEGPQAVEVFTKYAASTLREHRYNESLLTTDMALEALPAPEADNNDYACAITELWLAKGYSHFNLAQWNQARQAFEKVIEIHPWADSQNVQKARQWLRFVDARKRTEPYDPY